MTLHKGQGWKADRDRAILINSYTVMCREFRVKKPLDPAALARLSNEMLYKVNKDLYSQATIKQAQKLAIKMGLADKPESIFRRAWMAIKDKWPEKSECHSSTREVMNAQAQ